MTPIFASGSTSARISVIPTSPRDLRRDPLVVAGDHHYPLDPDPLAAAR